jgi:hypothetical protein
MLFHKGGIQHVISELTALEFLVKEYPKHDAKSIQNYIDKLENYVDGRGKESLNTIYGHSKNVLDHIKLDKDNHFKKFLDGVSNLVALREAGKLQTKLKDILRSQEQVQTSCVALELNLRELIKCITEAYQSLRKGRPISLDQMKITDKYRIHALNAARDIELRSTEAASKIKIVHSNLIQMRSLIEHVRTEAKKTHWVYSNINSWLE